MSFEFIEFEEWLAQSRKAAKAGTMKNFGMGKSGKGDDSKCFPAVLIKSSTFAPLRLCARSSPFPGISLYQENSRKAAKAGTMVGFGIRKAGD